MTVNSKITRITLHHNLTISHSSNHFDCLFRSCLLHIFIFKFTCPFLFCWQLWMLSQDPLDSYATQLSSEPLIGRSVALVLAPVILTTNPDAMQPPPHPEPPLEQTWQKAKPVIHSTQHVSTRSGNALKFFPCVKIHPIWNSFCAICRAWLVLYV